MDRQHHPAHRSLIPALNRARRIQEGLLSDATRRVYDIRWRRFAGWCRAQKLVALPAEALTVIRYLETLKGRSRSTLEHTMSAIRVVHDRSGYPSPTRHRDVRRYCRGLASLRPSVPRRAVTSDHVRQIIPEVPKRALPHRRLRALRDRALLLLMYAGALRKCEVRKLNVEHLVFTAQGLTIVGLRRNAIAIPSGATDLCPVTALEAWLQASKIRTGPVFRAVMKWYKNFIGEGRVCGNTVEMIVQTRLKAAGLDTNLYTPQSFRHGFLRAAQEASLPLHTVMRMMDGKQADYYAKRLESPWNRPDAPA